jgi:hypothetical protein
MNKTVIKGFTMLKTAEGMRVSYVYSIIDQDGNVIKENVNESFVVMDDELKTNIDSIVLFIETRMSRQR